MEYTLDELVAAVAARIAAAGLDRQANGQVSAFPDRRTLRYYTSIGLMGRPDSVRDRQAIYNDRHVAQAVAVKRLQASGLALAAIQSRLMGLPQPSVEAIAAGGDAGGTARARVFWAQAAEPPSPAPAPAPDEVRPMPLPVGPLPPLTFPATTAAARPMAAITLSADVTLLLATDQPLTPDEVTAIRDAAANLLDHLAAHRPVARNASAAHNRRESR